MKNATNMKTVVFTLSLNKENHSERIVIGEELQVRRRIEGNTKSFVLYDEERSFGEFLFGHENQSAKEWNGGAIFWLSKSLKTAIGRKVHESAAWEFLEKKEQSRDPICIFTSYLCRKWYLENRTMFGNKNNCDLFERRIMRLTGSFKQIIWAKNWDYSVYQLTDRIGHLIRINGKVWNTEARIWYPGGRRNSEWLIISDSFIPAILYYLQHWKDWNCSICQCDVCGRHFIAPNERFYLCSDACRKERNRQYKRSFDAKTKKRKHDRDYKYTSQRMRDLMNKFIKTSFLSEEKSDQIKVAFSLFRKEAIQRKKRVKTPADCTNFSDWLFEQERGFEKLCSKTTSL